MQIKECKVLLNNDAVTVVDYDGIQVQLPAIGNDADVVSVGCDNGSYVLADAVPVIEEEPIVEPVVEVSEDIENEKPVKKSRSKKKPVEE